MTGLTNLIKVGKWPILIVWLAVLVWALPFIGKLNDSLSDDVKLPPTEQSQKVDDLMRQNKSSDFQEDLEVVYENPSGLSTQNIQVINQQLDQVVSLKIDKVIFVSPVTYSTDKKSAYFTLLAMIPSNNTTGPAAENAILDKVHQIVLPAGNLSVVTSGGIQSSYDSGTANADTILLVSAAIIVTVLLILTYRSALLWIVPLVSAVIAISIADAIVYSFTSHGMQVSTMDSSILIVLVFGVATDYGMLLISRYREYLHSETYVNKAVALALKGSIEAITASAVTVVLALLALTFAIFSTTKDLGPVAAIGVLCAFVVQVTFLPAVLAISGRVLLWPRIPRPVSGRKNKVYTGSRIWGAVASFVSRFHRQIVICMTVLLAIAAVGLAGLTTTVDPYAGLRGNPPSVEGHHMLEQHFADITVASNPLTITADDSASLQRAVTIAQQDKGTSQVSPPYEIAGHPVIDVVPKATPYGQGSFEYIENLRKQFRQANLQDVNVGGYQAIMYDYSKIAIRDNWVLMPIILAIVCAVLGLLLRSIVAPIMLTLTVVISFACSLGISVLIFKNILHFDGMDPALPIYIFLFVVALGIDYNIFLMDRARQETTKRGTSEGMLHALRVTGGVITAAGLVLAGTFAALAQIPTVMLTEVGIAVSLGVLVDSFLVRTFLVPAVVLMIGRRVWWPSRLSRLKK
jgi:RND superfamily putative drug exporter